MTERERHDGEPQESLLDVIVGDLEPDASDADSVVGGEKCRTPPAPQPVPIPYPTVEPAHPAQ